MTRHELIEKMARAHIKYLGHDPDSKCTINNVAGDPPQFKVKNWEIVKPHTEAALKAINEAGFAIVPREANHDMKNVGAVAQDQDDYHHVFYDLAGEVYSAMIEEGEVK